MKAIFGLGMTPIYGGKNGQIKSLAHQNIGLDLDPILLTLKKFQISSFFRLGKSPF